MQRTADTREDRDILAYVDGRLPPEEAAAMEARLAERPEEAAQVESYLRQNTLIREAADALEPAATSLRTAALARDLAQRLERRMDAEAPAPVWRVPGWLRQSAAAIVLVGAGWVGHAFYAEFDPAPPYYVAEAVGAHRAFADDGFRPVEFTAEASDAAVQWAGAKLGHPVAIPELDSLGLAFVGSRLHGTAEGPIAQFLYEDAAGHRLSVIVAQHPPEVPHYGFTLASFADTTVGYWTESALDYAVVAETSAPQIEAIVSEIASGRL